MKNLSTQFSLLSISVGEWLLNPLLLVCFVLNKCPLVLFYLMHLIFVYDCIILGQKFEMNCACMLFPFLIKCLRIGIHALCLFWCTKFWTSVHWLQRKSVCMLFKNHFWKYISFAYLCYYFCTPELSGITDLHLKYLGADSKSIQ